MEFLRYRKLVSLDQPKCTYGVEQITLALRGFSGTIYLFDLIGLDIKHLAKFLYNDLAFVFVTNLCVSLIVQMKAFSVIRLFHYYWWLLCPSKLLSGCSSIVLVRFYMKMSCFLKQ